MITRKILVLSVVLTSMLACLIAAGERKLSSDRIPPTPDPAAPPALGEYIRIMHRFNVVDSNVDLSGNIRIYDGESRYVLKEKRDFHYIRAGAQFYAQLSHLQTYCDGHLSLRLDTLERSIFVSSLPRDPFRADNPDLHMFDRLFSDTARFKINGTVSRSAGEGILRIQSDLNPEIRSCTLYYDTVNYRLREAEVEWWKGTPLSDRKDANGIWLARLDYHYRSPESLDMSKKIGEIITMENGKALPRPAYIGYRVVTQF